MIVLALDVDRDKDSAARDASYQGWLLLLQEIITTTMAAIRGMPPLMLGSGISSALYRLVACAMVTPVPRFTIPHCSFDRPAGGGRFE